MLEEILDLINDMTTIEHLWINERVMATKINGIMEMDGITMMNVKG